MNQSIEVMRYSLHRLITELYEKRESLNTQVEKLEIQSQINALYDKIENLCIINEEELSEKQSQRFLFNCLE